MTAEITLTLRSPLERASSGEALAPDRLATASERSIAALPLWEGKHAARVGDHFAIAVSADESGVAPRLRLAGDLSHLDGLGTGMAAGELIIDGDAGRAVGRGMSGGRLRVLGSVGDGAGVAMSGGVLEVSGEAGDALGAAEAGASRGMTGGVIVVRGAAGADAGARMRRGVVVCGSAGARAGLAMIAGTLLALSSLGDSPGTWNKRGSLISLSGGVPVPVTYRYACTYRPPYLPLLLRMLRDRHGLPILESQLHGRYARYSGDFASIGRGEILEWVSA